MVVYFVPVLVGFIVGILSLLIGGERAAQKRHVASVIAGIISLSTIDFTVISVVIGAILGYLGELIFKELYTRFRR